jgi:trehalose transport system permease protein
VKHYSLLGLAPLALYLGAFTVVPVISTLVLSFRTPEGDWGLGAFHALAAHYQFGEAVVNTLAITGLGLVIELSLGLAAAAALASRFRAQGIVWVLLLIPLGYPPLWRPRPCAMSLAWSAT